LPKTRNCKSHSDQDPKSVHWDATNLAQTLHAQRNSGNAEQSCANPDVSQPGNAYPDKKYCPTGSIKSAASIMPVHERRHFVKVG